jgi:hypothetical protein
MAGFEDLLKQAPLTTVAIGVGFVVLAPVLLPVVGRLSKPLVKEFIKQGYLFYEKTREGLAEVSELAEDAIAEARMQLEQEAHAAGAAGAPGSGGAGRASPAGLEGSA